MTITASEKLRFFLMRMNLQVYLHALLLRRGFQNTPDRRCGEPVATDQHRHIRLSENKFETKPLRPEFRHFQLRLARIINQLDGHELEEIPQSLGDSLHGPIMHPLSFRRKHSTA